MLKILHKLRVIPEKLKKFRGLSVFKRPRPWIIGGVLLLIALVYPVAYLLAVSPAELSLAELQRSYTDNIACHETCALERQKIAGDIISGLKKNSAKKIVDLLGKFFSDSSSSVDFKIALINIINQTLGRDNPPDFLLSCLKDSAVAPSVPAAIIENFTSESLSATADGAAAGSAPGLDYYFSILDSDRDNELKAAAISAISDSADNVRKYSLNQLSIIARLIFSEKTEKSLRSELVLLLGNYYPVFPEETKQILSAVYASSAEPAQNENSDQSLSYDPVSQAFAADLLNRLAQSNLDVPEVSAAAWNEYYNN